MRNPHFLTGDVIKKHITFGTNLFQCVLEEFYPTLEEKKENLEVKQKHCFKQDSRSPMS